MTDVSRREGPSSAVSVGVPSPRMCSVSTASAPSCIRAIRRSVYDNEHFNEDSVHIYDINGKSFYFSSMGRGVAGAFLCDIVAAVLLPGRPRGGTSLPPRTPSASSLARHKSPAHIVR